MSTARVQVKVEIPMVVAPGKRRIPKRAKRKPRPHVRFYGGPSRPHRPLMPGGSRT